MGGKECLRIGLDNNPDSGGGVLYVIDYNSRTAWDLFLSSSYLMCVYIHSTY